MENIQVKLFKFGSVVQKEVLFKENVYVRRTHDGRRPITITYFEPKVS